MLCSKHVLNAQVAIRSPCCKKWFDCAVCHQESADHPLLQAFEMVFVCKKCKKAFRKDAREFEDRYACCKPTNGGTFADGRAATSTARTATTTSFSTPSLRKPR